MPYKHIKGSKELNGNPKAIYGQLNNALTVRELLYCLQVKVKADPSILDKAVLLSDDEEGNGYHGCYYPVIDNPHMVKQSLASSNWGDPEPDEYENAVIIG